MAVIWGPKKDILSNEEREMLKHPQTSGLIFFSRNYKNPQQMKAMIDEVKSIRDDIILSVDQEGGRVQRFKDGMSILPSMQKIGSFYKQEAAIALDLAYNIARLCAAELKDLGINLNYAPVLDLDYGVSEIIGDRSFGDDPQQVIELGKSYIRGLADGGVAAVAKHFPGHGAVAVDSHLSLPEDNRTPEEMQQDIEIYKKVKPPAIMTSHIRYSKITSAPVSFSSSWIKGYLRKTLKFDGLVISDDLCMGAVAEIYDSSDQAALAAIQAGCDLVLICNNIEDTQRALDSLQTHKQQHEQQHKQTADKQENQLSQVQKRIKDFLAQSKKRGEMAEPFDEQHARDLAEKMLAL